MSRPTADRPKGKPGRRKKPAVPQAPVADLSLSDVMALEVQRAKARAASGARLANHESRALRDAWLLDQARHLWPSSEVAAADLGVSVTTLRSYADEGCPDLVPHSPIPKAPVLAWLLTRAHARGGSQHASRSTIEEAELAIKQAKAAKLTGSLIAEAEDRATQGLIEVVGELRHHLLTILPAELATAARAAADGPTAADTVAGLLEQALRAIAYRPPAAAQDGGSTT